jgi:transposase
MNARSREQAGSTMEPETGEYRPQLNDEQWALVADLFAEPPPNPRGGRPRAEPRRCLEGILWVLKTGARWKDLPRCFPSYVTCWRRFVDWSAEGIWEEAWRRLLQKLDQRGAIRWNEGFADGTFASAKKGVKTSAPPSAAKAPSSWCSRMARGCRWRSLSPAPVPRRFA